MKQTALPWQPYLDKKYVLISSVQDRETFFARTIGFFGIGEFKYAIRIFQEQMTLLWQRNLGKKQNCNN